MPIYALYSEIFARLTTASSAREAAWETIGKTVGIGRRELAIVEEVQRY
jgi:hypothetical protein